MRLEDLQIDRDRLASVCQRYRVARLEVFGSFVSGDAAANSDLDVLVTLPAGSWHPALSMSFWPTIWSDLPSFAASR